MPSQVYKWKRFWCSRSGSINLADGGYLCDPDAEWGKAHNPDLVTFETISYLPCLALLGEPGIGKTQALEAARSEIVNKIQEQGNQVLFLDLRSYGSEDRLVRSLFDSPEFKSWQSGTHQLHIFLDSFDEWLLRVDTLATLLVDEFKRYRNVVHRLCLRIACRTAVWQPVLEEGLKEIWGENSVGVYELAPLRRADVIESARAEGISPDDFLKEVGQKNIVPLAIKPVTLGFLLNTYRRYDGQFPPNQRLHELYLESCKLLCEEVNESRRSSNRRGNLDVDQRLIVAARIAAITIFANRFAVWTGVDQGNIPAEDVLLQKLCHGSENANEREFEITRVVIEEVLDTGLFSSRGLHRIGWAHQTYGEFLAAWFLKQRSLNLSQILNLIIHPDRRVVPQLQETTAWLSGMMPEVFQEIIKTDPDVLLQSDISTVDDENKAQLVESLLKFHDEEKLEYFRFWRYNNLDHPGLPGQLEPYIRDVTKSQGSRLVAIDIAQACDVKAVQDSLADIALDPAQLYVVRTHAAHTICAIGDEETKVRLLPLALGEVGDNPNDALKGYGLRAVWSRHITIEDLLNHLSQPLQRGAIPSIGGVYQDFIARELVQHLQLCDLPVMLKWLERFPNRYNLHYPFRKLADSAMLKSWQNLNEPGVLEAFSNVAILRLKRHNGILGDRPHREYTLDSFDRTRDADMEPFLRDSDEKRRQLIEIIVSSISESETNFLWLTDVVYSEDILWVIEHVISAESHRIANIWVKLLSQALTWHNLFWKYTKHIDAILKACNISSVMRREFESDITPVELNSEKAEQAKTNYLERRKPLEPEPTLDPPPKQRVLTALEKVEAEQPQLWWQIVVEMTLVPTSKEDNHDDIFESDITKLPGWEEAEAGTKARTVETAKNYLHTGDPETQKWIKTNNFSHPPFAGYQALYLLAKQEPEFVSTISRDTWTKWIPTILKSIRFSHRNGGNKDEVCGEIVRTVYQNAPDEFIETLITLMIKNNYQPRTFYSDDIYRLTNDLLDQCLASEILDKVPDEDLNAGLLEILLTDLFKHNANKARLIAVSFFATTVPESGEVRNKAIVAACALANHADNSSWSVFWAAAQQDHEFGRKVLESIASQSAHEGQIEQKIKEEYLADLYIFLAQQYPKNEQLEPETQELRGIEAQILGEFDGVRMWKNYIPQRLQARGTLEACDALQKIIRELPEQKEQLQPRLLEAESLARRNTWQPLQPEQILQLVSSQLSNQNTHIQTGVLIMQGSNNPNLNFGGTVGAVNVNSTVHGNQIGTQHNYASEQNLVEAFDEIQQIFDRLTQNYPTSTESEQQIVVAEAVKEIRQNPTLMKRVKVGGQAFIFEALQKASDQWWVSPFVKAIEAGIKGE